MMPPSQSNSKQPCAMQNEAKFECHSTPLSEFQNQGNFLHRVPLQ